MHKNIHVHLYRITIEYTRTLLYNTVRNKENNKHRKEVKIWREQKKKKKKKKKHVWRRQSGRSILLYRRQSGEDV